MAKAKPDPNAPVTYQYFHDALDFLVEKFGEMMDEKLAVLEGKMETRFQGLERRLDRVEINQKHICQRLDKLEANQKHICQRLDRVETNQKHIRQDIAGLKRDVITQKDHDELEQRVERLETLHSH